MQITDSYVLLQAWKNHNDFLLGGWVGWIQCDGCFLLSFVSVWYIYSLLCLMALLISKLHLFLSHPLTLLLMAWCSREELMLLVVLLWTFGIHRFMSLSYIPQYMHVSYLSEICFLLCSRYRARSSAACRRRQFHFCGMQWWRSRLPGGNNIITANLWCDWKRPILCARGWLREQGIVYPGTKGYVSFYVDILVFMYLFIVPVDLWIYGSVYVSIFICICADMYICM